MHVPYAMPFHPPRSCATSPHMGDVDEHLNRLRAELASLLDSDLCTSKRRLLLAIGHDCYTDICVVDPPTGSAVVDAYFAANALALLVATLRLLCGESSHVSLTARELDENQRGCGRSRTWSSICYYLS